VSVAVGFTCQYGNFAKQLTQIAMPWRQWQNPSGYRARQNAMALPVCCHKQAMRADGQADGAVRFIKRAALQDCKLLHNAATAGYWRNTRD
jgi:hypothetical protein